MNNDNCVHTWGNKIKILVNEITLPPVTIYLSLYIVLHPISGGTFTGPSRVYYFHGNIPGGKNPRM